MTYLLHNIKASPSKVAGVASNYNTREQIQETEGTLTFDGVYKNVYENRDLLVGRDVILFVMGDYVGGNNSFDKGMPYEDYCNWKEIDELVKMGCKLGWHTWSHRDLTTLSYEEQLKEVTPPYPMEYFAYPYGRFNGDTIRAVRTAGFKKAYAVYEGDNTDMQILRRYI